MSFVHPLVSLVHPLVSFVHPLVSLVHPLYHSSTPLCHLSTPLCHSFTPLCHLSTPLCHLSTPLRHLSTPLRHLSTPLCHTHTGEGSPSVLPNVWLIKVTLAIVPKPLTSYINIFCNLTRLTGAGHSDCMSCCLSLLLCTSGGPWYRTAQCAM